MLDRLFYQNIHHSANPPLSTPARGKPESRIFLGVAIFLILLHLCAHNDTYA